MKIELYYYDQCPFCQKILRAISELKTEEKITLKNTLSDREASAYHLKRTGRTTVPCLYVDDSPMFESDDIVDWLKSNLTQS